MFVSAKQFCEETGFPLKTLTRYIREGFIPHIRAGRRYVLDKDAASKKLAEIANTGTGMEMGNAPSLKSAYRRKRRIGSGMDCRSRLADLKADTVKRAKSVLS